MLDTDGNGKRDAYVEPDQPVGPGKDKRIVAGFYGISVSPVDGTVWATSLGFPGSVVHLIPGAHPPETALAGTAHEAVTAQLPASTSPVAELVTGAG